MGTHMKTTVELSDDLLQRSRRLAQREGSTLRALLEDGLRLALKARERSAPAAPFQMLTFEGDGLSEEYQRRGLHQAIHASYGLPLHDRD